MPSCVAVGCHRRGEPILKGFPRKDLRRRQIWVERVNRPGWTPTNFSALCERHFEKDQWEFPRQDGKRKLKASALPTVFVVPPSPDGDGIFQDHAYCLPRYRKFYEDGEFRSDSAEAKGTIPIEHIKVEAGEDESFTPETVEEQQEEEVEVKGKRTEVEVGGKRVVEGERRTVIEGGEVKAGRKTIIKGAMKGRRRRKIIVGGGTEEEEGGSEKDVESIQCTPDISVFPERGEPFPIEMVEPFPIEMVECQNDDGNELLAEPDHDPLEISPDDQVRAATMKPYFGNSQKFLFIPKSTKLVVNVPTKAAGDPAVSSAEPENPLSGNKVLVKAKAEQSSKPSVDKPRLKVKSLDGLLDPSIRKSSTGGSSVDSKVVLRSPSAVYVKEPLTLTGETVAPPVEKPPSPKKLEIHKKVVTLTSSNFTFPPNLKITTSPVAAPPKLNLVSKLIKVQKDPHFIRNATNLKLEKPIVLPPRPNIFISKPTMVSLKDSKDQFIQREIKRMKQHLVNKTVEIPLKPGDEKQQDLVDKTVKIPLKPGDEKQQNLVDKTVEIPLKPGDEKQQNLVDKTVNIPPKPSDERKDENVEQSAEKNKFIFNSPIKRCIMVKIPQGLNKQLGDDLVGHRLNIPYQNKNSNSLLKTVTPKVPAIDTTFVSKKSSIIVVKPFGDNKTHTVSADKASPEGISSVRKFLSGNGKRSIVFYKCSQCKLSFTNPLTLQIHKKKTGHFGKEPEGNHGNKVKEKHTREEEDVIEVETSGGSDDSVYSESDVDTSSDSVSSQSESETETASEISNYIGSSSESNFRGWRTSGFRGWGSEAEEENVFQAAKRSIIKNNITSKDPRRFDNHWIRVYYGNGNKKLKKNKFLRPLNQKNLARGRQSSIKTKVSKPMGTNQNSVESFESNGDEEELVVLSSSLSSCSYSSQTSNYNSDVSSEDEISSESKESSNSGRNKKTSSAVGAQRLRELIKKKKELEKFEKESQNVEGNSRKPIVLSPKVDSTKEGNHLTRGSNRGLRAEERIDEIVISDDEETNDKKITLLDECSKKSALKVASEKDKEGELTDSIRKISKEIDEKEIKEIALKVKPIILIPKLNLDTIKSNTSIKREFDLIDCQNFYKEGLNNKLNSVQKIQVNEGSSKELLSLKRKKEENSSLKIPTDTLLKVKADEMKTSPSRNSSKQRRCFEKYRYRGRKKIPKQNLVTNETVEILEEKDLKEGRRKERSIEIGQSIKPNKDCSSAKRLKPNEEKDKSNKYEKSPESRMRKCKLCGVKVQQSQFKHHVLQHTEMASVCKVCSQKFTHSVLLRRHMKSEHCL